MDDCVRGGTLYHKYALSIAFTTYASASRTTSALLNSDCRLYPSRT